MKTLAPVSYTHLDVYKRQYLNFDVCTDLSEFRRMFYFLSPRQVRDVDQSVYTLSLIHISEYPNDKGTEKRLSISVVLRLKYSMPVSYTHLDVYKRQVLYAMRYIHVEKLLSALNDERCSKAFKNVSWVNSSASS